MAAFAAGVSCERYLEMVRGVAASARGTTVEGLLRSGLLVAATAGACDGRCLRAGGVRVVASLTASEPSSLWVIRVHVPVAVLARRRGALAHVVRLVAARAVGMRRYLRCCEHDDVCVAVATRDREVCSKLMGAMTVHAGVMATGEQCARRHHGLRLTVTLDAGRERIRGWGVLMSVTSPTSLVRGFAALRMRGHDAAVTARALA